MMDDDFFQRNEKKTFFHFPVFFAYSIVAMDVNQKEYHLIIIK
jgi:hypothetical protein